MTAVLTGLLSGVVWLGCAADEPGASAPVVRDSAGITIVENSAGAWTDAERWRLPAEPVLDIGVVDGPIEYQLFNVVDAVRLSDGRIAVANGGTEEIKFYDADGTHLRTVGGEGGGPGEFQSLTWIGTATADTLLAWDAQARRLSLFTPSGDFLASVAAGRELSGFFAPMVGVFDDGTFVLRPGPDPMTLSTRATGAFRDSRELVRFARDGTRLDTIMRVPGPERFLLQRDGGFSMAAVFFGRQSFATVAGSRLYVADNDRYEVALHSAEGAPTTLVRKRHEAAPVDPAAVDRLRESMLASYDDEEQRRRRERVLSEAPARETSPAFSRLLVDDERNLWVAAFRPPGDDRPRWDVFDPDGRLLGSVETPPGLRVMHIGAGHVVGRWRDEYDVDHVAVYELIGAGTR